MVNRYLWIAVGLVVAGGGIARADEPALEGSREAATRRVDGPPILDYTTCSGADRRAQEETQLAAALHLADRDRGAVVSSGACRTAAATPRVGRNDDRDRR